MIKPFIYLAGILVLAMTATFAANAQDINALQNNSTSNSTIANNTTIAAAPAEKTMNIGEESHDSQNLSTINGKQTDVADISEMAGAAPLVAAGASSAQSPSNIASSFKIGTGVGGLDPFNPKHVQLESLKLGLPIKPMRDTGKMFFVCDIV
ncbi:MAG: hypothetical protein A4E49_00850 [Methanosaeta sp. PtaU1.Bin112]|nr:MAG: hypothetical protein A4E49_00850 [Methanosaeta sp. PtaU1.Bin112]